MALLALSAGVSCGPGEKEFTFLVRDADNRAVAGVEVRLAGEDRRLGVTDDKGRATVRVRAAKGASLRFRLADAGKPGLVPLSLSRCDRGGRGLAPVRRQDDLAGGGARRPRPDPAGPVTLRITSEPSGGQAFLDGTEVGTTPADLHDVTPGRHQIEVRMAGRQPYTLDVVLEPGEHTFHADLPRQEEARATLRVTSDPPGAQVVLDGRPSGRVTPAILDGLAPGRHTLRLQKDGFEPFQTTVDLTAGGPGGSAGGALRPRLLTSRDLEEAARARPSDAGRDAGSRVLARVPGQHRARMGRGLPRRRERQPEHRRPIQGRPLGGSPHLSRSERQAGVDVSLQFEVKPGDRRTSGWS